MNILDSWITASIEEIESFCSSAELNGLKSRLDSACDKEFSRGVSELVVSSYYAKNNPNDLYIPRGAKKDKDIDVSLIDAGLRINIEVKCPDLSSDTSKKFTLNVPYTHQDFQKGKELEREMSRNMGNNLNVIPNKVLNFEDFLNDCSEKFEQSSDPKDINIVFFSMLDLKWMDDYRIKIEEENRLRNSPFIDVVVLSNAALLHSKSESSSIHGFENCFNYLIFNNHSRNNMTLERKKDILSCVPNHTIESRAWYKELVKDDDPIGTQVKSMQRLALYSKIAITAGAVIQSGG